MEKPGVPGKYRSRDEFWFVGEMRPGKAADKQHLDIVLVWSCTVSL